MLSVARAPPLVPWPTKAVDLLLKQAGDLQQESSPPVCPECDAAGREEAPYCSQECFEKDYERHERVAH